MCKSAFAFVTLKNSCKRITHFATLPHQVHPIGQVPVGQLGTEELDLPLEFPTLKELTAFSMLMLPHFLHLASTFSAVTPINKSKFSPHSLHTYV